MADLTDVSPDFEVKVYVDGEVVATKTSADFYDIPYAAAILLTYKQIFEKIYNEEGLLSSNGVDYYRCFYGDGDRRYWGNIPLEDIDTYSMWNKTPLECRTDINGGIQEAFLSSTSYDIDQLRRQFPEEIDRFINALVNKHYKDMELRIAAVEDDLQRTETEFDLVVEQKINNAKDEFYNQTLQTIANNLKAEIDEYISQGVIDIRTGEKYKFYIDTQANIEALTDREDKTIYIGKEALS